MKLIAIGYVGSYRVYVNLSKEDAIKRYNQENPDYTVEIAGFDVREIDVVNGRFDAYDIWDEQ